MNFKKFLKNDIPMNAYLKPEKNSWASKPAIGGKKKVQARRTTVNFHPNIPISMGKRPTAHNDQAVTKATMVPTPAPARRNPAAIGKLT